MRLGRRIEAALATSRLAGRRPALDLLLRLAAVLVVYLVVESWMRQSAHLPARAYEDAVIAWGLLRHLARRPLAVVLIGVLVLARHRDLRAGWSVLERGPVLRGLVLVVAGTGAWAFATYDYNLYFDRAHTVDRLLLVVLAALIAWRPAFVLPLAWLLFAVGWQFDYPMVGAYPWTDMNLVLRPLVLFGAAFLVRAVAGVQVTREFVTLLLCLLAAHFWGSGLGKLQLGWLTHPHLHLLILGAYANGWLNVWEPADVVGLSEAAAWLTRPLMAFTLFVECGALFILLRRRLTLVLLASFLAFHVGVFLYTGMLFWKWMVLEATLLALLWSRRWLADLPVFTPVHAAASLVVIGAGPLLFAPPNLSWYDTPVSTVYDFRGVGASGTVHPLPDATFAPYGDTFTLDLFNWIGRGPQLTRLWDITLDRGLARRLLAVDTPEELLDLEARSGETLYDAERVEQLDDFLVRFLGNLNRRGDRTTLASRLQPPRHLWTLPAAPVFAGEEPLTRVQVVQVLWLYADHELRVVRETMVHEVEIPTRADDLR